MLTLNSKCISNLTNAQKVVYELFDIVDANIRIIDDQDERNFGVKIISHLNRIAGELRSAIYKEQEPELEKRVKAMKRELFILQDIRDSLKLSLWATSDPIESCTIFCADLVLGERQKFLKFAINDIQEYEGTLESTAAFFTPDASDPYLWVLIHKLAGNSED